MPPIQNEDFAPRADRRRCDDVSQQRLWIALIFSLGLLLRLAWVSHLPGDANSLSALPDQLEYLQLGQRWLATGTFAFHDARFDQDIYAYRTPGYPCFIALCGGSVRIVRVVQAVIDSGSIIAIFLIARSWLTGWRVWVAPGLVAVNPWLIYFSGLLLGETTFAALLIWGMWLLTRKRMLAGLVVLIAGVFIRPSSAFFPAALALLSPLPVFRERVRVRVISDCENDSIAKSPSPQPSCGVPGEGAGNRTLTVLISLLLTFAALFPWAIRNHQRLGAWIWLTTNSGITLYDGFNPRADGSSNQSFASVSTSSISMNEVQRDRFFQQQAISFIRSHPAAAARLVLIKILRTWSPFPLSESYRSHVQYVVVGSIYAVPLFALTFIGLWRGSLTIRQRVFLLTPAIYITIVHGLTIGSLRYRIPADVPMAVIAASGLGWRATVRPFERPSPAIQ